MTSEKKGDEYVNQIIIEKQ